MRKVGRSFGLLVTHVEQSLMRCDVLCKTKELASEQISLLKDVCTHRQVGGISRAASMMMLELG